MTGQIKMSAFTIIVGLGQILQLRTEYQLRRGAERMTVREIFMPI